MPSPDSIEHRKQQPPHDDVARVAQLGQDRVERRQRLVRRARAKGKRDRDPERMDTGLAGPLFIGQRVLGGMRPIPEPRPGVRDQCEGVPDVHEPGIVLRSFEQW
jgi:hypothetical protein